MPRIIVKPNRWKGLVLGSFAGLAGAMAMSYYWKTVINTIGYDPRKKSDEHNESQPLDDISLVGKNYEPGESSTDAMGRIIYTQFKGQPPQSEETKTALSYIIHWLISMFASGLYGAIRGEASLLDMSGGLGLATGLWLFGDELAVPMLGLAGGPTAYSTELHVYSYGAHVAYGLASAAATQILYRITP